jgi:hypothetical protein
VPTPRERASAAVSAASRNLLRVVIMVGAPVWLVIVV